MNRKDRRAAGKRGGPFAPSSGPGALAGNLAQVLRALGRTDEAIAHLTRATELRRDHVTAHRHVSVLRAEALRIAITPEK